MGQYHNERGNKVLRILDRYIGIPCIAFLSLFHKKRPLPSRINSIGLLKTAAIGDTILLTGVFNDLRAAYPEAKLVFFTGENNYKCATLIKSIDKVIPLPIKKPAKLFRLINQFSFDVFLDFGPWPRINSLISYLVEHSLKLDSEPQVNIDIIYMTSL